VDDSCGKCSAPLGQRARVCLQCGATRVPLVAVDAVQDAPIEVRGTVEEIETTSPVEAALPVTPSEERAEPSPLKVEASVGPETIATEAVSVEVANSPHQEPRSGVPVSLVVILVLITALFASIFAFVWNSNPAGAGDAESVSMYVSGRANARDRPSAEGSSIMGTYDVGTLLSGTWVNGVTDANERWLKFEADGQTRYIWDGNLSAEALSSSASSLSAAPSPPSLGTYLGKYPYEKVSGVSFWEHPAVVAQVEKLISSPAARGIILGGGVETPIAEAGAQGEYLFAYACEQHNCGSHNWSVAIKRDGSNASVCYYNADGGPIASANYDDTMEYTEAYEGCQLGD
jgi:hypothetical protein